MATRGRAQGQAVIEFLGKRPAMKHQSLVGSVSAASRFEDTRQTLIDKLSQAIEGHLGDIPDDEQQRQHIIQYLRQTAMVSSALQIGALSAGMVTAAQLVDLMMGGPVTAFMVLSGGMVLAQGRNNLQKQHYKQWKERSDRLDEALQAIGAKEVARVERRILDGVAPYTRFVETEKQRLDRLVETSEDILSSAHSLRSRINKL